MSEHILSRRGRPPRDIVYERLDEWAENWNDDPKPFVWHKTADEILTSLKRYLVNL